MASNTPRSPPASWSCRRGTVGMLPSPAAGRSFGGWTSSSPRSWPRSRSRVRRLAQDKVKPRAREIDDTGEYPQDLFEAVPRRRACSGSASRRRTAASGAGILGLTIAIEEVAKYSNTAALMLLLTRLPTGPGDDRRLAGAERSATSARSPTASQRAAFGLSEPQAGSDVMGMRTRAVPRRRRLGPQRHQVLDVGRGAGRLVLRVRQVRRPT